MHENKLELDKPCEEASPMSFKFKIDCGRPAVAIVWHNKDQRAYRMCLGCADHNVTNRGGVKLYPSGDLFSSIDTPKA